MLTSWLMLIEVVTSMMMKEKEEQTKKKIHFSVVDSQQ